MAAVLGSPCLYTWGATSPPIGPFPMGGGVVYDQPAAGQYVAFQASNVSGGTVDLMVHFLIDNAVFIVFFSQVPEGSTSHTWQAITLAT